MTPDRALDNIRISVRTKVEEGIKIGDQVKLSAKLLYLPSKDCTLYLPSKDCTFGVCIRFCKNSILPENKCNRLCNKQNSPAQKG
ncbi:hypothetical protein TNCT_389331 [Trichonephila clavata]|uniref:Uncharacterized protein n=1 Tax=Trichonephila clavata TaxID=2740835 RepID=A0A8X6GQW0_TRICU|nr:hypothetical protein TNCT_388741 [Trichonephila clavata]GFR08658.1 hypothetical protein TNCT_389331 [Trichonephila clavata]